MLCSKLVAMQCSEGLDTIITNVVTCISNLENIVAIQHPIL